MDEMMTKEKFEAQCLKVIDKVKSSRKSIILTRKNIPVAKLVPVDGPKRKIFGRMKGTVHFLKDITQPINEN